MKRLVSLILCAVLVCAAFATVWADETVDDKARDNAPGVEWGARGFADDRFMVVFNKETSRKALDYTPEDFPEIDCVRVEDLTEWSKKNDRETYSQIVMIYIAEPGKQNVLDAIELIKLRDDVISAGPDYVMGLDDWDVPFTSARDVFLLMKAIVDGTATLEDDINGDGEVDARDVIDLMWEIVNT